MSSLLDLTIVIPVRNEEGNLPGCIAAIGNDLAQKIVIIDSSSTDSTCEIASQNGIEVIQFNWDGHFPKKRNWFLRTHTPTTKWVMFIDADEYLTESFKTELRRLLPKNDMVGYWLNYSIYFLGKKLIGGYPLKKLALFKVGAGEYEMIAENQWSKLDMEVHEHPVLVGNIGIVSSKIDHQDFRGVSHYIAKHNEYSSWEAGRYLKAYGDPELYNKWTRKQRIKYKLMRSPLIGPLFFLGSFIFMGGFRDGSRGLVFAIFKMSYFTEVYCKIKENQITK